MQYINARDESQKRKIDTVSFPFLLLGIFSSQLLDLDSVLPCNADVSCDGRLVNLLNIRNVIN